MMVISDRQFIFAKTPDGRIGYFFGWALPNVYSLSLPDVCLDFEETVIQRQTDLPTTVYGHRFSFSYFVSQKQYKGAKYYLLYGTSPLTEGRVGSFDDIFPIALAAFLRYVNRRTLLQAKVKAVREAAETLIEMKPEDFLDFIMDLTTNAKKKFFISLVDWLQTINAFSYDRYKVLITVQNNLYRLVFQVLCLDLGLIPRIRLSADKTTFVFTKGSDINQVRKPEFKPLPEVKGMYLKNITPVFDRSFLVFGSSGYIGNNVFVVGK